MQKIQIISMIKVNGEWLNQNDMTKEEFRKIMEKKFDDSMSFIGFDRKIKTA